MDPAPRDRGALLTALTTEHFTLQGARSATITESLGRSTIYLGSLSASLVAFALIAQGESTVADFRFFALLILPGLSFLGTVTFVRIVETGIEDATYAQAINRIRRYYLELAGEDARYFALGANDDMEGVLANMGLTVSRWRGPRGSLLGPRTPAQPAARRPRAPRAAARSPHQPARFLD